MDSGNDKTLAAFIRTYIRARDENRPHLMEHVFLEASTLEMIIKTNAIAFPPFTRGRAAISEILVSRFAKQYENIYTFCLSDPPPTDAVHFKCVWFVAMSEKDTGSVRVGFGLYAWSLGSDLTKGVERLMVLIERMEVFRADLASQTLRWVQTLPYPWCPVDKFRTHVPPSSELEDLVTQAILFCAQEIAVADALRRSVTASPS